MRPASRFRRFAVVVVVTLVLIGSVPASTVVDAAPSQATSGERSPGSIGPPKVGSSSADVRSTPAFDPPGERVGTASLDALETRSGDGPRLSFDDGDLRDREDAVLGTAWSDSADTLAPDLEPVPGGEAITEVGMSIDHEDDHHDDEEEDHHDDDEDDHHDDDFDFENDEDDHHDDGENDHDEDDFDFETNDDDEEDHHDDGENDHHEDDFDFETNDDDEEDHHDDGEEDHHDDGEDEDDHHDDEDRSGSSDTDSGGTDGSAAATSVFQGQSVRLTGLASNTVVPVQRVSPAASAGTVGRIRTDENGRATIPTDELPAGTYLVEGPRSDESFSVVEQTLTVGGDTVVNSTGPGVAGKFVLTSNRRGSFPMQVTATRNGERVSAELIAEVFEDSTGMPIREVSDDTVRVTVIGAREGAALIGDFNPAEAGEYRFQFYVPDTATLAEEPIRVRGGPPRAALAAETVAVDRGDVARIPVGITGRTDSALLRIGGEASGYRATLSVEDGDGDGRVLVEFDTRAAGATGTGTHGTVARAADANDTVTLLDQTASETAPAPGGYWIRAGIRTADSGISRTDTGMLSIGSRATTGIRVWRAPGSVEPDVDGDGAVGRTDLAAMADSGRLSRADTVATTDLAVVRVEATGLESLAGNRSAFEESLDEELALVISPEEGDADPDAAGGAVRIDGDDVSADGPVTLVPAPEQGDYFVVIDLARAGFVTNGTTGDGGMRPGSAYTVTFAVTDDRLRPPNGDGPRPVRAAFELAGPVAVFEEETMTVGPSTDRTIRGVSSLAPGTELAVSVEPVTGSGPAAERRKTVVGEDGRFNVSVGFDASAAGDTFAVTASKGSTELGSARIRVVSESTTPTPTVSSRQEASGTVEEGTTPTESAGAGRTESTVTAAPETGSGKPTAGTANRGLEILPGRGTGLSGPDIARVTSLGLGVAVFVVVGYRRWT